MYIPWPYPTDIFFKCITRFVSVCIFICMRQVGLNVLMSEYLTILLDQYFIFLLVPELTQIIYRFLFWFQN